VISGGPTRIPILVTIGIAFLEPCGLFAQHAASAPAFEVASVKPTGPQGGPLGVGFYTYPGGRILASACTLDYLLEQAFDIQPFQIAGGAGWIHEDRYDIDARPPASSKSSQAKPPSFKSPPNDEQRQMLQTLLADRFQLKYHRETREGPVYLLVKTNKELKLQDAKDKDAYPWAGSVAGGGPFGDGIAGVNCSMQELAKRLSPNLGHPVLDRTGLAGSFDFRFEYHSDDPRPDIVSSILTSVQGLGLKLESAKGPVETLAIDRAEKPSGN
jgi:uncharacterized protein (TIGR03435 family)